MSQKENLLHLREFVSGYIAAALWSTNDESTPSGGDPLDQNYGADDIAPESMDKIILDCQSFIQANQDLLDKAANRLGYSWSMAGHDFWLTRNGHGSGFWDREALEAKDLGEKLSNACRNQSSDLYVGDDGKLYVEGAWSLDKGIQPQAVNVNNEDNGPS